MKKFILSMVGIMFLVFSVRALAQLSPSQVATIQAALQTQNAEYNGNIAAAANLTSQAQADQQTAAQIATNMQQETTILDEYQTLNAINAAS